MNPAERADNLEFWAGRDRFPDAGEDPDRRNRTLSRPAIPAPRSRLRRRNRAARAGRTAPAVAKVAAFASRGGAGGRARPLAAAALLAALTAGWLAAGQRSHDPAAIDAGPAGLAAPQGAPSAAPPTAAAVPTTVPLVSGCSGLSAARPAVRCVDGGIEIEVRLLTAATITTAYARATGTRPAPTAGPPACADGEIEERSWSAPGAPAAVVGRYRCTRERGRAVMWWTHGARLFHAVAADDDLARLFGWWRARPSE